MGTTMSPTMCVDLNFPTFRFFARALDDETDLKVEVAYPDSANPDFEQVALLLGGDYDGVWGLTEDVALSPERGGTAFGGRGAVLRFTVIGTSPTRPVPGGSTTSTSIPGTTSRAGPIPESDAHTGPLALQCGRSRSYLQA